MKKNSLAGCLIVGDDGGILLLHRRGGLNGQWEIPGGKVQDGEIASEAARRELREELGIEVRIVRDIGRCRFKEQAKRYHYKWYLGEISDGDVRIIESDRFDALQSFSWNKLENMIPVLSKGVRKLVKAHRSGQLNLEGIDANLDQS